MYVHTQMYEMHEYNMAEIFLRVEKVVLMNIRDQIFDCGCYRNILSEWFDGDLSEVSQNRQSHL